MERFLHKFLANNISKKNTSHIFCVVDDKPEKFDRFVEFSDLFCNVYWIKLIFLLALIGIENLAALFLQEKQKKRTVMC